MLKEVKIRLRKIYKGKWFKEFIRFQLSSEITTALDLTLTFCLSHFAGVYYVVATFIGSVSGGNFNCVLNYRWTFHPKEYNKKFEIACKYLFVWSGSIALNTWGTYALTELMKQWITGLNWSSAFMLPRIIVAILVGCLWNYRLQKIFVYRDRQLRAKLKYKLKNKLSNNEL